MFVTNYSKEERMAIVMECRKSGLTDALWCKQHDIPVGTFYSWVKNFRRQGIAVPAAYGKNVVPVKQEVVKVDIVDTDSYNLQPKAIENPVTTDAGFLLDDNSAQSSPIYERCHHHLLNRTFAMADETRLQVLKEPERRPQTDSFMWLFRSGNDGEPPIILYKYHETRNGDNARAFLKGFNGYLMTDGFSGYNKLSNLNRCCCYAHLRRYFIDAIPAGKENDLNEPAVQGRIYIDKLFDFERRYKEKGYSFEKIKERRLKDEKPVIEAFLAWLDIQIPRKGSRLAKALTYANNRRPYMFTYLEDGRCSLHNNDSEQMMKSYVTGRKNWLFADSTKGADALAICYSMVEMAKANGLDASKYLEFLLKSQPTSDMSPSELDELLPWSTKAKQACSLK